MRLQSTFRPMQRFTPMLPRPQLFTTQRRARSSNVWLKSQGSHLSSSFVPRSPRRRARKTHREKQLKSVEKFQVKLADKELQKTMPVLYAQQQRAKKKPFSQKLKSGWAWLKEPKNYIHPNFYHVENPKELSFFSRCIFLHWKYFLVGLVALGVSLRFIPIVSRVQTELNKHRDRKSRGVLGLDQYCTPATQNVKLEYIRTGDFSFDIRYLQKMILRDLFVIGNLTDSLRDVCHQRKVLLETMLSTIHELESHPYPAALDPFQREILLHISEYNDVFNKELEESNRVIEVIDTNWKEQVTGLKGSIDIQLDTFINLYIAQQSKRDHLLDSLINNSEEMKNWRTSIQEQYDHIESNYGQVYEAYLQICKPTDENRIEKKRWNYPGLLESVSKPMATQSQSNNI